MASRAVRADTSRGRAVQAPQRRELDHRAPVTPARRPTRSGIMAIPRRQRVRPCRRASRRRPAPPPHRASCRRPAPPRRRAPRRRPAPPLRPAARRRPARPRQGTARAGTGRPATIEAITNGDDLPGEAERHRPMNCDYERCDLLGHMPPEGPSTHGVQAPNGGGAAEPRMPRDVGAPHSGRHAVHVALGPQPRSLAIHAFYNGLAFDRSGTRSGAWRPRERTTSRSWPAAAELWARIRLERPTPCRSSPARRRRRMTLACRPPPTAGPLTRWRARSTRGLTAWSTGSSSLLMARRFDVDLAKRLVDSGMYLSPTLQANGSDTILRLRPRDQAREPAPHEPRILATAERDTEITLEQARLLAAMGLGPRSIAGRDAGCF